MALGLVDIVFAAVTNDPSQAVMRVMRRWPTRSISRCSADTWRRRVLSRSISGVPIVLSMPVDAQGINIESGIDDIHNARLAYVTPSHQFPLGMAMRLERRRSLLAWG
jgi:hypothetical protein